MSKIKITKENDMLWTAEFLKVVIKEARKRGGELNSDEFIELMKKWCVKKNIECPLN